MKMKVSCTDCGHKNWPGKVYCEKCSGHIYREELKRKTADLLLAYGN